MNEEREEPAGEDVEDGYATLFRGAVVDPPQARFDHRTVVTASRRITRRRQVLAAAAGVVVVLGGGGALASVLGPAGATGGDAPTVAAGGPMAEPEVLRPFEGPVGDDGSLQTVPLGPAASECAQPRDPELRAVVERVVPEIIGAPNLATTDECRTEPGERGMQVEVADGRFSVTYLPPGAMVAPPVGAVVAPTASGGSVLVSATGPGNPLATRLDLIAEALAPLL